MVYNIKLDNYSILYRWDVNVMKPFVHQELEACSFIVRLLGTTPQENAWKALNNLFVEAKKPSDVAKEDVKAALKQGGVKFNEENLNQRNGMYRKVADTIYADIMTKDDALLKENDHMAELMELPEHVRGMSDKAAKKAAYFTRCGRILTGEEKLDINGVNALFGYDYEDGLEARKQVFVNALNVMLETITKTRRFSADQEAELKHNAELLDVPYEFKNNIQNALDQYKGFWDAENRPLQAMDPEQVPFEMEEGEECRCFVNCGLCERKTVEREDNLLEMNRRFSIDEGVSFKGGKVQNPKIKEEITAVSELGYFFLTSRRCIYMSQTQAFAIPNEEIKEIIFDGVSLMTLKLGERDAIFKFSDEAGEAIYILVKRVKAEDGNAKK